MIEYYRIPTKKKGIQSKEIMTVFEQYQLKDAIHNKTIIDIKVLNLRNSNINDKTLSLFWTISDTLKILDLNISQNFSFITDDGINELCQANNLRNLKILNASDNSLTNQSLKMLSKANHMMKIEQLILYGNSDISSQGLIYIAQSEVLKNIKKLDLHDTSICDKGMKIFIKSENSTNLTHLNLSMNNKKRITDDTLRSISMSKFCDKLKELKVEDCEISDDGIAALSNSPNCKNMEKLILNNSIGKKNNFISDQALQALTYAKQMNKLKVLQLRNTDITTEGINSLSISLASQNFEILRLSYCPQIRDNAALYIQSIIKYRNLTKLYLNGTSMSSQTCKKLGQKYPAVHIIYIEKNLI